MIVGFSKHSTGEGKEPVNYLTDRKRPERAHAPPEVLRGDPKQTINLIDSLEFKHKYTSGVLSFAPGEKITPEMENTIIDRFEKIAFAGLDPDQYNILWVRHTHAGHNELHFLTPRVELSTSKSLNIKPPGKLARATFDDFRSEINARYGLADPDDPKRARNISTPDHELKIAAEALRKGKEPQENIRKLIDIVLTERAVQGLIKSREDLLKHVKDLGFEISRQGKDYITVLESKSGGRWRLKGPLYARDYEPSRTLERAEAARERDYSKPDARAAQRYAERVNKHIAKRAEYHHSQYSKPKQDIELERDQKSHDLAHHNRPEPFHRHLQRELGNNAILHQSDDRFTEQYSDLGEKGREDTVQHLRREREILCSGSSGTRDLRKQRRDLHGVEGILNDRTRETLIERLQAFGETLQRATDLAESSAKRLAENVRAYFARKSGTPTTHHDLEHASQQLKRTGDTIKKIVQHEQTIEQKRQEQRNRDRGIER
ncbi:MAG: hypothetical protein JSC188_000430 [Candidatus Tokpelaia sp. JSC188]|nr:MAG: hypothetical protein JSC188_000430 [Candidatus Tokpelaia sp. JSC188]